MAMKTYLTALLTFSFSFSTFASTLNCKDLWKKGYPEPRFPEGLDCALSKKLEILGAKADVYHYTKDFPRSPEDTGFTFRAQEVFTDVINAMKAVNDEGRFKFRIKPLAFIFTDQKAAGTEKAMVRVGHANEDENEPCPIVVFADAFKAQGPDRQRQMLAHEIFHCVQDTIWREKITETARRVHEWWVEGSATWFSNVVYPAFNQEYDYKDDYLGNEPLVLQAPDNSYSTYLFFQSMSTEWLGVSGVLNFINDLPDLGDTSDQIDYVTGYPSMNLHFATFAKGITSAQLKDFNGVLIPASAAHDADIIKVKEGEQEHEWSNKTLTFKVTQLDLPAKTIVSIDEASEDPGANPLSIKLSGSGGNWNDMYSGYPTTVDMSCRSSTKSMDILSSYAGDAPLDDKFKIKIKTKNAECQCVDKFEFDKCLAGDYEIDRPSLDKVFTSIFRFRTYEVENTNGQYLLNVSSTQKFTFTEKDFSASVIIKDETYGDIRVFVKMNGSTDALGKLVGKNELCFSDIGNDYTIYQRIEMPFGTVENTMPYSQFDDFTRGPIQYKCNKNEIVFVWKLPTGPDGAEEPHDLRFVRK